MLPKSGSSSGAKRAGMVEPDPAENAAGYGAQTPVLAPSVIGGPDWTLAKDKGNPLQSSG
jgi:hypothetical protein